MRKARPSPGATPGPGHKICELPEDEPYGLPTERFTDVLRVTEVPELVIVPVMMI